MIGLALKQYRIVEAIGAGGMGEVYRARDTRLDRDVALKVLRPGALADDAARKRFRKEALVLSRLSHPHIASLFDFDTTEGGVDFLVMELVRGPSLDATVRGGPLPEKDVVKLGAQIARALVAAHEQGVVHRDLKPANVKMTPDGLVKVLDFGLARIVLAQGDGATTDTASGTVAGTPPYMSPEQLLGREVDERTDVHALGVVLYEMATGRKPFGESSGPQLVARILSEPVPPPREANPGISPQLEQVILKASDKDQELRHQTARDLLVDLERLAAGMPPSTTSGRVAHRRHGRGRARTARVAIAAVALAVAVGLVQLALATLRPAAPRISALRTIAQRAHGFRGLATDGTNAYFAEMRVPVDALLVVPLSGGETREMPLPWEGRVDLFVFDLLGSPSALLVGKRVSAQEGFELWRLPLVGGAGTRLDGVPRVGSARAARGGDRVAFVPWPGEPAAGGVLVSDSGGTPRPLVPPEEGARREIVGWHDGDTRLRYLRYPNGRELERYWDVSTMGGMAPVEIPADAPGWFDDASADGRLLAWGGNEGTSALRRRSSFWPWAEKPVHLATPSHVARLRFTPDGRAVVALVERPGTELMVLAGATNDLEPLLGGARAGAASFSPDGGWVAWVGNDGTPERVWRSRPDGSQAVALTDPGRLRVGPMAGLAWSPEGRRLAFPARGTAPDAGPDRIHVVDIESGTVEPLSTEEDPVAQIAPCWDPDGRSVVYSTFFPPWAREEDTYLRWVDLATRRIDKVPGSEGLWDPRCAPDGRLLARDSVAQKTNRLGERTPLKLRDPRSGRWEALTLDLATFDYPTWARDGRTVYATGSAMGQPGLQVVRLHLATRRVETLARIEGLRSDGWLGLTPRGDLMVHRDASVHEVVVMDLETR